VRIVVGLAPLALRPTLPLARAAYSADQLDAPAPRTKDSQQRRVRWISERDHADANLQLVELKRPYSFASPFGGSEFVVWVLAEDSSLNDEEMSWLAAELVSAGCRDAVCSGYDCSKWDAVVDWAYLRTCPDNATEDHNFVMTTWQEDENLGDIAFFFANNTAFEAFVPHHFLVLSIGAGPLAGQAFAEARGCLADRLSLNN
jgi:hypothetical protein